MAKVECEQILGVQARGEATVEKIELDVSAWDVYCVCKSTSDQINSPG